MKVLQKNMGGLVDMCLQACSPQPRGRTSPPACAAACSMAHAYLHVP